MDTSLKAYITQARAHGTNDADIRAALLKNGWKEEEIDAALRLSEGGAVSLPSSWHLLRQALHQYGEYFWTLLGLAFVPGVLAVLGATVIGGSVFGLTSSITQPVFVFLLILLALVVAVAVVYIALWGQVALYVAIRDRHEAISLVEAFRRSRSFILPFFTTSLVSGLVVLGGVFAFGVPGIIIAVLFAFVPYLVVTAGVRDMEALMRSRDLVAGRLSAVIGRLFVMLVAIWVALAAVQIIVTIVGQLFAWPEALAGFINSILQLVVSPLASVYSFLLFETLVSMPKPPTARSTADARRWILRISVAGYVLMAVLVGALIYFSRAA